MFSAIASSRVSTKEQQQFLSNLSTHLLHQALFSPALGVGLLGKETELIKELLMESDLNSRENYLLGYL